MRFGRFPQTPLITRKNPCPPGLCHWFAMGIMAGNWRFAPMVRCPKTPMRSCEMFRKHLGNPGLGRHVTGRCGACFGLCGRLQTPGEHQHHGSGHRSTGDAVDRGGLADIIGAGGSRPSVGPRGAGRFRGVQVAFRQVVLRVCFGSWARARLTHAVTVSPLPPAAHHIATPCRPGSRRSGRSFPGRSAH